MIEKHTKEGLPIVTIDAQERFNEEMVSSPDIRALVSEQVREMQKSDPYAFVYVKLATSNHPEDRKDSLSQCSGLYR